MAIQNADDVIIICEDDHQFTADYKKGILFKTIINAQEYQTDLLSGGTAILGTLVPVDKNLFWIDEYVSTQFIVVFKRFFHRIINETYDDTVLANRLLSEMTTNKLLLYPFISTQKDFGYSDCTELIDRHPEKISIFFRTSIRRIDAIYKASLN